MNRDHLPSLLLLPYPPQPATRAALDAAYCPPLAAALSKSRHATRSTTLIVAVACPILHQESLGAKSISWAEAQSLLAGLYGIISVICGRESIGTDVDGGPGTVDARVVLIDHQAQRRFVQDRPAIEANNTVVVDLATFAAAYHPWNFIYHASSEEGYDILATYLKFAEGAQKLFQSQLVAVQGGVALNIAKSRISNGDSAAPSARPGYTKVCLGGTFDHLHPGHKLLLAAATILLDVPRKGSPDPCQLVIGMSGDALLKNKKYAEQMQPWEVRSRAVLRFLWTILELSPSGWKEVRESRIEERPGDFRATFRDGTIAVQCVEIQDAFGPTITMSDLQALALSAETRAGGPPINDKRVALGWKPLEIFEVDVLDARETDDEGGGETNFAAKISSTEIRRQKAEVARTP